jgi:hypothetical protein
LKVKRGKPQVVGIDPEASGLILIDVPLDPTPDHDWSRLFGGAGLFDAPPGFSVSASMHPPSLRGSTVRLRAPDTEVERYLQSLDERIEATNAEYEKSVLPELERQRREEEEREETERRRLEEAQRRLDDAS